MMEMLFHNEQMIKDLNEKAVMTERNRRAYKAFYQEVNWIDEQNIWHYEHQRSMLLDELDKYVAWGFHGSKADTAQLSPGCRLCGEGEWSCLFVNNVCNASCFYCPSKQDDVSIPTTSSVSFDDPYDYVAYLKKFGFKGASISGGEPFMTFDKTLRFIRTIRKEMGDEIYIWMYTNGILAEMEKFRALREAGLNEVRFDLSAIGYKMTPVHEAAGIIDNITVEIPAIPEDYDRVVRLLPDLKSGGVNFLNLHQIRLTDFNHSKLQKRGYTFLHGPKPTVLESELTALKILLYAYKNMTGLPVNYCSYIYRYRFQGRASRIKQTRFFTNPREFITETGLIRNIAVKGKPEKMQEMAGSVFRENGTEKWHQQNDGKAIIHESLLPAALDFDMEISVSYQATKLRNALTYKFPFKTIRLSSEKEVYIERGAVTDEFSLTRAEGHFFNDVFCHNEKPMRKGAFKERIDIAGMKDEAKWMELFHLEKLEHGLYPYY